MEKSRTPFLWSMDVAWRRLACLHGCRPNKRCEKRMRKRPEIPTRVRPDGASSLPGLPPDRQPRVARSRQNASFAECPNGAWRLSSSRRKSLEHGIAARISGVEVVWLYGYGWAIYRGGPMYWAGAVGLKYIADGLLFYAKETIDPNLQLAPPLKKLAAGVETFTSLAVRSKAELMRLTDRPDDGCRMCRRSLRLARTGALSVGGRGYNTMNRCSRRVDQSGIIGRQTDYTARALLKRSREVEPFV